MYKTTIFDLDGTLIDSRVGIIDAVERTVLDLGLEMPSPEVLRTFIGPPIQESFAKHFGLAPEKAMEIANMFRDNYRKYSILKADVYEGIVDLLKSLKAAGKKVAIATYKTHDNAIRVLDGLGLLKYCDYAQGSDVEGNLTKADIIKICTEKLETLAQQCVMVGDSSADAVGAQRIGMDFIALTYGFGFSPEQDLSFIRPVAVCGSAEEIKSFLLKETFVSFS